MAAAATSPSSPADTHDGGLRERSKARRRAMIQRAAMKLFAERGYDGTTIAEIAEAADVAPRTVSGYFPSKVDLATAFADEIAGRLTAIFDAGSQQDIVGVFDAWLREEVEVMDPETFALARAMHEANPALGAIGSAHVAEAAERGRGAIAAESGRAVDHPMVVVCLAAIGGALGAYLGAIAEHGASEDQHSSMIRFLRGVIDATRAV